MLCDPVDEERDVGDVLADPVRIGPLCNGPLQDVAFSDACEESVEVAPIRYQRRFFQKPPAAVTGRVVIPQATALFLFQHKAVRRINFERGLLLIKQRKQRLLQITRVQARQPVVVTCLHGAVDHVCPHASPVLVHEVSQLGRQFVISGVFDRRRC